MTITATMVKELRERTGAGMMDCKKALQETNGDIDAAIEAMRKAGVAKAAKKSGRIAAEGTILIKQKDADDEAVIIEINCETDFVAKDENFQSFANAVADTILNEETVSESSAGELILAGTDGTTIEEARLQLVAKIGENIGVRRFERVKKTGDYLGAYTHGNRIGVLVNIKGGDEELARDIAMHIAASRPVCVAEKDVPEDLLETEKKIYTAQAQESGKPAEIIEKMVTGKLKKYLNEVTLLGQPYVKDPDITIAKLLAEKKSTVINFFRYEVGEGIEKDEDNFADEVMKQAGMKE